jgi:hypothetical protein
LPGEPSEPNRAGNPRSQNRWLCTCRLACSPRPSRHTAACPLPASIPRLPAHHEPPARPRLYLCVFFCFYSRSRDCFGSRPTGKRHCSMHALRPARNAQRPHGLQKRSAGLSTPTQHAYISLSSAPGPTPSRREAMSTHHAPVIGSDNAPALDMVVVSTVIQSACGVYARMTI